MCCQSDTSKRLFRWFRVDSRFAPSQWEMVLLCSEVSHWPRISPVIALLQYGIGHNLSSWYAVSVTSDLDCGKQRNYQNWMITNALYREITWLVTVSGKIHVVPSPHSNAIDSQYIVVEYYTILNKIWKEESWNFVQFQTMNSLKTLLTLPLLNTI